MGLYSIKDFNVGESVYHLSNMSLFMVVIGVNHNPEEVTCRWLDKTGKNHLESFLPQELRKESDLFRGSVFTI